MTDPDDAIKIIDIGAPDEPKTIDRRAGIVREKLAIGWMIIVALTIVTAFVCIAARPDTAPVIKEIAVPVIQSLITALGVIQGFYFGSRQ